MMAFGGWIGSYSGLDYISSTNDGFRSFSDIRSVFPGMLQYDLAPT